MAQLIEALAITGSRKNDGSPNSTGRLWAYVPGTTTAIPLYADYATTKPLTQPVALNAAGKTSAYLKGRADLRIEDSTGALVDTFTYGNREALVEVVNSGFTGTLASGSQGAGGITDLGTALTSFATSMGLANGALDGNFRGVYGTVSTPVWKEIEAVWINAKRFGALGDGVNDDTTNIQAALNAASAQGGGVVFLPAGTYKISAVLTVAANVILQGAGRAATTVKNTAATTGCFTIAGSYAKVRALSLSHSSSSTGRAIQATGATDKFIEVREVIITGHRTGAYSIARFFSIEDFDITTTAADASARGIDLAQDQSAVIKTGAISAGTGYGIQYLAPAASASTTLLLLASGVSVSAADRGIYIDGSVSSAPIVSLVGCGFKGTTADIYVGSNVAATGAVVIDGSTFLFGGKVTNNGAGSIFIGPGLLGSANIRPFGGDAYQADVAAAGNHTPLATTSGHVLIRATSAGTITVNSPGLFYRTGQRLVITFYNASGGAVTWTMNAVYRLVAAPSPANGQKSTMEFVYDGNLSSWNQVGAVATYTA